MSDFSAHRAMEEAQERNESGRSNPTVAITAAIFAVLAALATMLAHSRSTTALAEKNEAILAQARSSDAYNYYESKRIKYHLYGALHDAGLGNAGVHARLQARADTEERGAVPILQKAQGLEAKSETLEQSSELALKAYETLEIAVTLFEISIVLVSISALAQTRSLTFFSMGSAAVGLIFLIKGMLAHF